MVAAVVQDRPVFLLFGGYGIVTAGEELLGDTWLFDLQHGTWQQLQPVARTPSARSGHAVCVIGNDMYLYGTAVSVPNCWCKQCQWCEY
jgi:hypothetical protein